MSQLAYYKLNGQCLFDDLQIGQSGGKNPVRKGNYPMAKFIAQGTGGWTVLSRKTENNAKHNNRRKDGKVAYYFFHGNLTRKSAPVAVGNGQVPRHSFVLS